MPEGRCLGFFFAFTWEQVFMVQCLLWRRPRRQGWIRQSCLWATNQSTWGEKGVTCWCGKRTNPSMWQADKLIINCREAGTSYRSCNFILFFYFYYFRSCDFRGRPYGGNGHEGQEELGDLKMLKDRVYKGWGWEHGCLDSVMWC